LPPASRPSSLADHQARISSVRLNFRRRPPRPNTSGAKAEEKVKKLEQDLAKAKQEAERARQEADRAQQQRDAVKQPTAK